VDINAALKLKKSSLNGPAYLRAGGYAGIGFFGGLYDLKALNSRYWSLMLTA
jgi:hypothetical protein